MESHFWRSWRRCRQEEDTNRCTNNQIQWCEHRYSALLSIPIPCTITSPRQEQCHKRKIHHQANVLVHKPNKEWLLTSKLHMNHGYVNQKKSCKCSNCLLQASKTGTGRTMNDDAIKWSGGARVYPGISWPNLRMWCPCVSGNKFAQFANVVPVCIRE